MLEAGYQTVGGSAGILLGAFIENQSEDTAMLKKNTGLFIKK